MNNPARARKLQVSYDVYCISKTGKEFIRNCQSKEYAQLVTRLLQASPQKERNQYCIEEASPKN